MLKLEMLGNLGADATLQQNERGKFITFSVYHSEFYTDRTTGERVKETQRASVSYNASPENLLQYLKTGTKVFIRGFASFRLFTGQDHLQHIGINIRATELEIIFDKLQEQQPEKPKPF